ncbi:hypothetical protein GA0074695_6402 [Micromonospora viridifaciens]|uniref:Uncharacterized protein n=1 Tax=Micromonospora viridifaciens TaxID=1881 RepID=A0A1C5A025_MICVI|nr:hypothetical protein [Micromonospora viridifaciens]SCF38543.1 hypothetical protein GA0074695_6402 [Micromonospora viridifaciens]
MFTLLYWLFLYFLLTIPVFLGLALLARLTGSAGVRRAAEVVMLTGGAALLPVVLQRAYERPVLWPVVVLLAALLMFGVVMHVKAYQRPS